MEGRGSLDETTPARREKMEACLAVEKEQERVAKKLEVLSSTTSSKLQMVIDQIDAAKSRVADAEGQELSEEHCAVLKECLASAKAVAQSVSQEHKDVHGPISKYGRSIDKYFAQEISAVCVRDNFSEDNSVQLSKAICEHLLREGRMDVAETLINESGLSHHENFISMFTEIHQIAQSLRSKEVELALEWALAHRRQLEAIKSRLEFKLRQRKFLCLLSSNRTSEAVAYAKVFGNFTRHHLREVQRLMGCLLYAHRGLENCPYSDLLDPWHWSDVIDTFTRDACQLLGLSLESPLAVSLSIGCTALPQLLHLQSVMMQRQVSDVLSRRDELPCEISLSWNQRYHSIFTCPILRQQTSDANPPVRLVCGHAISRDAMKKLVSHSGRLKCPYCPMEMNSKDVKELKF